MLSCLLNEGYENFVSILNVVDLDNEYFVRFFSVSKKNEVPFYCAGYVLATAITKTSKGIE